MRFLDWYKTLRTVKSPAPGEFGDTTDARAQDNMALHRNDSWTNKICGSYRIFPQFLYTLLSVAWVIFKALVHPLATYLFHSFSPQSQSSCSEQQRIRRFRRKIADFSLRSLRFWCWCPCILWLGLPTRLTAIILLQLPELASCSKNMDVGFLYLSQKRNHEGSQTILLSSNKANMPALYDSYWRFLDT